MSKNSKKLFITLLCLAQYIVYSQETKQFRYNGSGSRSNGTFDMSYYIESEGRTSKLDGKNIQIDLNKYKHAVYFVIEFSNLKLGLNRSFSKVKNKDHPKVFYLEFTDATANDGFAPIIGPSAVTMDASGGHYAEEKAQLKYEIKPIDSKKVKAFSFKLKTINGVHDLDWNGLTYTCRVAFLPSEKKIEKPQSVSNSRIKDTIKKKSSNKIKTPRYTHQTDVEDTDEKSAEQKLWTKIQDDILNNKQEALYEKCALYIKNCELQLFESCSHEENALYLMALNTKKSNRKSLIATYIEKYPEGQFIDNIEKLIPEQKADTIIPIKPHLAKIEFDNKALVINRVEGGKKPYFVAFYNYKTNKKLSIAKHRFYNDNYTIALDGLDMANGLYYVKVTDSNNTVFAEAKDVYVGSRFELPKSLKLGVVLFPLLFLGFLYKKYIHF